MKKNIIFTLTGPSGAGKSTLIKGIKQKFDVNFSISHTTRAPREGEKEGVDYFFISDETFDKMLKEGDFLEWTEVYGNRYGTSKREIEKLLKKGKDIVLDLDLKGALRVKDFFKDAIVIFIGTENLKELKNRLKKRGERDFELRLSSAKEAVEKLENFDYLIINKKIEESLMKLESIFIAEHLKIRNLYLNKYKEAFLK